MKKKYSYERKKKQFPIAVTNGNLDKLGGTKVAKKIAEAAVNKAADKPKQQKAFDLKKFFEDIVSTPRTFGTSKSTNNCSYTENTSGGIFSCELKGKVVYRESMFKGSEEECRLRLLINVVCGGLVFPESTATAVVSIDEIKEPKKKA